MNHPILKGIIAYPITPFLKRSGAINLDALSTLINQLIDDGAHAIAALGSAGEAAYLDEDEWLQVAKHSIEQVKGRVPVIIGIAELTTERAIEKAVMVEQMGADVVMIAPLSYYPLSETEIYEHFQSISDAISIPIMLYNNPATTGVDMSPEFMLSMVKNLDQVSMIKESSGDIQRMHKIYSLSKGEVPFYNGCNYLAFEALNAGASGWCTAAPCLIGDQPKALYEAIQEGNIQKAFSLFHQQRDLLEFIVKKGLAASVKAGLSVKGFDAGVARRPLLPLNPGDLLTLKNLLETTKD